VRHAGNAMESLKSSSMSNTCSFSLGFNYASSVEKTMISLHNISLKTNHHHGLLSLVAVSGSSSSREKYSENTQKNNIKIRKIAIIITQSPRGYYHSLW